MMSLSTPIGALHLVGPVYAKRLKNLGIETINDLLNHYPSRYEDYSHITPIAHVQLHSTVTIQGTLISIKNVFTKNHKKIQQGIVEDNSGSIQITWYNQPFLTNVLKEGDNVSLSGQVGTFANKLVLTSPEYEILRNSQFGNSQFKTVHTARLVPIYPETYGVSSKWIRSRVAMLLATLNSTLVDPLSESIRKQYSLEEYETAIKHIHFPPTFSSMYAAKKRLSFDELLYTQLAAQTRRLQWKNKTTTQLFKVKQFQNALQRLYDQLPFELTNAQKKVVSEITKDLERTTPMNRLIQGDVGSGKTAVAAIAMYIAHLNGAQSTLMAPTEILAQQHYKTLKTLLEPLGLRIELLTGSVKPKDSKVQTTKSKKKNLDARRYTLDADITVGTHAIIGKNPEFERLGLVVIDEQQRFGVEQRALLREKGKQPHLLSLTATPIPRTIALTLYGELDVSVIDELPGGRKKIKTWVIPEQKRNDAYKWISGKLSSTVEQAFIICPLIEESETLGSIKAVKNEYERLSKTVFPHLRLALLHGKLKPTEKNQILTEFKEAKYDILVATPVVEVGIDIPTATIMVIEGAERFGLSQLHQLRGRVGRGTLESYCLLFMGNFNPHSKERLEVMQTIHDGMKLSEIDLKNRGAGELYGTAQHGTASFKIADLSDIDMVTNTHILAIKLLSDDPGLKAFPLLHERINMYTINSVTPD